MRLDQLAPKQPARIAAVDWAALAPAEARRLRELGVDEEVEVELLHRSWLGGDPIACRIGRMIVALRRGQAARIAVEPLDAEMPGFPEALAAEPEALAAE